MAKGSIKKARWAALRGDHATAGDFYRLAGQLEQALEMYRKGRQHRSAAEVAAELGDHAGASRDFERAGKPLLAAEAALAAGEKDRAATLFVRAGQSHRAGRIHEENGRFAAAAPLFELAGDHVRAARLFLDARQPTRAARTLEVASPGGAVASDELLGLADRCARQLLASGHARSAAGWFERCGNPILAARAWQRAGDYDRAVRSWLGAGHISDAVALVDTVGHEALDPALAAETYRAAGDWAHAAALFLEAGRPAEAAECLDRLGCSAEAGFAHEAAGDVQAAAASRERAGDHGGAAELYLRAGAHADAARCLETGGEPIRAAECALEAGLPFEAARLFEAGQNIDRAVEALQTVLPASDEAAHAAYRMGELFEQQGLDSLAVEQYGRALDGATTQDAALAYRYARTLERLGRVREAIAAYRGLVSSAYGYEDAARRLARLEERAERAETTGRDGLPSRYRVEAPIEDGLPGESLAGHDTVMDRPVTIRRFGPDVVATAAAAERLLHDIRRVARLHHPAIAAVYEAGTEDGRVFLVQERVPGRSLRELIVKDGALDVPRTIQVLTRVAEALDYAHGLGLLARNLRPETIVVPPSWETRLTDFGLAFRHKERGGQPCAYRPPEADRGERMDPASDVYLLGVLGWEMLTGSPPPPPDESGDRPTLPSCLADATAVPDVLRRVIERAVHPDRARRLGSAQELLEELHGTSMLPGALLANRYEILRELGHGGMGTVYQARDLVLDEAVALKVLKGPLDETAERRFVQEIRLARQISHRNVVRVHTLERWRDVRFIVMEYIEGKDLRVWCERRHPIPVHRGVDLLLGIASGLAAAHRLGIVHRDIKPENVLIDASGQPLIVDFGIARQGDVHLTKEGIVIGSPAYMAPEQIRGEAADQRADLYALGIIAHLLLTGTEPFASENVAEVLKLQLESEPPPLVSLRRDVPPRLSELVSRLLAKSASSRPNSVFALIEELTATRESLRLVTA